jgi:hypothetical protein
VTVFGHNPVDELGGGGGITGLAQRVEQFHPGPAASGIMTADRASRTPGGAAARGADG